MLIGKSFTFETQLCSSSNRGGNLLLWHAIGCFDSQVNNLSKELHSIKLDLQTEHPVTFYHAAIL